MQHRQKPSSEKTMAGAIRFASEYRWNPPPHSEVGVEIRNALDSGKRENIVRAASKGMTPELFAKLKEWRLEYNRWRQRMEESDKSEKDIRSTDIQVFMRTLDRGQKRAAPVKEEASV